MYIIYACAYVYNMRGFNSFLSSIHCLVTWNPHIEGYVCYVYMCICMHVCVQPVWPRFLASIYSQETEKPTHRTRCTAKRKHILYTYVNTDIYKLEDIEDIFLTSVRQRARNEEGCKTWSKVQGVRQRASCARSEVARMDWGLTTIQQRASIHTLHCVPCSMDCAVSTLSFLCLNKAPLRDYTLSCLSPFNDYGVLHLSPFNKSCKGDKGVCAQSESFWEFLNSESVDDCFNLVSIYTYIRLHIHKHIIHRHMLHMHMHMNEHIHIHMHAHMHVHIHLHQHDAPPSKPCVCHVAVDQCFFNRLGSWQLMSTRIYA